MAYIKMSFYSQSLGMNTSMEISMPDNLSAENSPYVLYLLHGLTDDNSIWTRWSRVDRYAAGKNMVIVMPCGYRGFYTDLKIGYKYFSYLSQDIPQMLKSIFKINPPREKTFAAGNSMGGYGAVKLGLRFPERFSKIASFSGALDICSRKDLPEEYKTIFGDNPLQTDDLFYLLDENLQNTGEFPSIYQMCGCDDFLREDNLRFYNKASALGYDITYEEKQGNHDWDYWDMCIKKALEWFIS